MTRVLSEEGVTRRQIIRGLRPSDVHFLSSYINLCLINFLIKPLTPLFLIWFHQSRLNQTSDFGRVSTVSRVRVDCASLCVTFKGGYTVLDVNSFFSPDCFSLCRCLCRRTLVVCWHTKTYFSLLDFLFFFCKKVTSNELFNEHTFSMVSLVYRY